MNVYRILFSHTFVLAATISKLLSIKWSTHKRRQPSEPSNSAAFNYFCQAGTLLRLGEEGNLP